MSKNRTKNCADSHFRFSLKLSKLGEKDLVGKKDWSDKKCKIIPTFVPSPLPVEHKSSRFTSQAMLWRLLGVTGADKDGGGGITGGGAGGGNDVSSNESSENLSSSSSSLSLNRLFRLLFFMFIFFSIFALWMIFRLFMRLSIVWMLILIPNEVAFVGEVEVDVDVGDFGLFMKSSFFKINPLLDWRVGDVSSFVGDLSSCDDDDDRSLDGFFRHTSRCRSIEPGSVRGGTRFCGSGPG